MIEFTIEKTIKIKVRVKDYSGTIQDNTSKEQIKFDAIAMFPKVGLLLPDDFVQQLNIQDEVFKKVHEHMGVPQGVKI
jgi:hypothetical protein